jgi:hypothetical protein
MKGSIALALILLPGCLSKTLRGPAGDHFVQAQTIADNCERGRYTPACAPDLKEDVDAMAKQAECILAITNGDTCDDEGAGK